MKSNRRGIVNLARVAAPILIAATLHSAASAEKIKRADWVGAYSAVAMGTGHSGLAAGRATRVEIDIYRWTAPEERQAILELIATGDGKAIRKGLDKIAFLGRIRIPGQSGYDLMYAWHFEDAGKNTVVVAVNRPLLSQPGATSGGGVDFLVGVVILELDAAGEGKGVMAPAVELEIQPDGKIDVSESAADPVELKTVKPQ